MLADKHTRNVCLLYAPSDQAARGVLAQDAPARTPLWSTMMKPYPSANGHQDPKQADGNDSGRLALYYPANEGWQWGEDIQAWANHHHVLSLMGFKFQICLVSKPPGNPLQARVAPNGQRNYSTNPPEQKKQPPIPGPSPSSQPPEDDTACEPDTEVAPTQSTEEPF
ncbi:hypothetical protein O181_090623, partial [Austropuccinia psidii MF-1]|nr:hypothetical protein [Austropuccinia psidii MF-1]